MPHQTTPDTKKSRTSKAEKARRLLVGAVAREDSDDELGLEDLPWEWIYEDRHGKDNGNALIERPEAENNENGDNTPSKRSKRVKKENDSKSKAAQIVGARMGCFECRVGDCVLLKAEGTNEAWVGLICDFVDDEENGMAAHFMWFSSEKEIRNKAKKRTDFVTVRDKVCE